MGDAVAVAAILKVGVSWGMVFLGLIWIWSWLYRVWWRPMKLVQYFRSQGINGPPYKLVVGNVRDEFEMTQKALLKPMNLSHAIAPRVVPFFHQTIKQYGKMSLSWFGNRPRVSIMDPELIKEVLIANKFGHFRKSRTSVVAKSLITGLVLHEDEKWVKHRRILNPAFHQEKLKRMLPAFHTSCFELIRRWEELVSSKESCELDVWPEFQNFTGDVISRTAFGSSYKEGMQIFHHQREVAKLLVQSMRKTVIPGYRFLPTEINIRRNKLAKEIRDILRSMIEQREKEMKVGNVNNDDLLGLLMESNFKDSQELGKSNAVAMTIEDVIDECKLFYFAGQETTAILLTWTFVALSLHQNWQAQAREEVLQIFGTNTPDFDGLNRLKIVTMILYEVLRLYPPASFLSRSTCQTTKLGNVTIPGDVIITIPILLIHHDRDIWGEDADEFNPERFSEGISKATNNQLSYFPFGAGPRICIGQNFALIEAKMAMAMILQRFSFKLSPTYAHAPCTVLTLHPQHGVQIILHKL